jgi:hypothetical protein
MIYEASKDLLAMYGHMRPRSRLICTVPPFWGPEIHINGFNGFKANTCPSESLRSQLQMLDCLSALDASHNQRQTFTSRI